MSTTTAFTIEGKIHQINETQTFDSGFAKREFVVETSDQYPQMIKFELLKDKTTLLDQYQQGQLVVVSFDVRGNEYQGKYYVNLVCWKLESNQPNVAPPQQGYQQPPAQQQYAQAGQNMQAAHAPAQAPAQGDDDIPF